MYICLHSWAEVVAVDEGGGLVVVGLGLLRMCVGCCIGVGRMK